MSGIAGYIGKELIEQDRVQATLALMRNRGQEHFYETLTSHGICATLLHSSLGGSDFRGKPPQPFTNAPTMEGYYTIVLDGEIYNYVELREQLKQKGVSDWKLQSEIDIILQCYIQYGEECVKYFEGMWSFAIFDHKKTKLFLSRDRFGEKPLFYSITPNGIFFASEIKYIQALAKENLSINYKQIIRYLATGYMSLFVENDTFFQGVKELPPATNLVIDKRLNTQFSRYWSPIYAPKPMSLQEAVEGFRHHLLNAVKIRLPADVPLASYLSGGVDSASITSIIAKHFNRDVTSFSMIIPDERYNEYDNIMATIADLGCKNSIIPMPQELSIARLRDAVRYHDSPITTISYYLLAFLTEAMAKQGFKVCFSGHGVEGMVGGNFDHISCHLYEMRHSPNYPQYLKDWEQHIKPLLRNPHLSDIEAYFRQIETGERTSDLDNFAEFLKVSPPPAYSAEEVVTGSILRQKIGGLFGGGGRTAVHEEDLNHAFYSLENRIPCYDYSLTEFAYSIPNEYLVQGGYGKYIMREAVKGILNEQARTDRKKVGFNAPFNLLVDLKRKESRDYLLEDSEIFELVDRSKFEPLLKGLLPESYSKFMFYFLSAKIFLESL